MFNKLQRWLKKQERSTGRAGQGKNAGFSKQSPLNIALDENLRELREIFDLCSDAVIRELNTGTDKPVRAVLVYIEGLVDKNLVSEHMLKALQINPAFLPREREATGAGLLHLIEDRLLGMTDIKTTSDMRQLLELVLAGDIALLVDGCATLLPKHRAGNRGTLTRRKLSRWCGTPGQLYREPAHQHSPVAAPG